MATNSNYFFFIVLIGIIIFLLVYFTNKRTRAAKRARKNDFPESWSDYLKKEVAFYRDISTEKKKEFEKRISSFLATVKIHGIGLEIDDELKLLVAASGVIPFFELPFWDFGDLHEVFVYPNNFDMDYEPGKDKHVLGLVGDGGLINHLMILSKPALVEGFKHPKNLRHVGFHEFAHILDRRDGTIDGIPSLFLPEAKVNPWLKLVYREMKRIRSRNSDINPYALTNEAEFFAVVSEYYLEHPEKMEKRHPELFEILELVYR